MGFQNPIYGILSPVYGILDWVPYMGLWIPSTGFKSHIWDSESRRRDSNKNPIDGTQDPIYGILKSHIWDSESRRRDSESQIFFWIYSVERIKLTARVECGTSVHAIFQLTVRRIQIFFSLKPSQSQGDSSLKISAHQVYSFRRS